MARNKKTRATNPPDDEELAFLAAYDPSEFPRPSVAVDVVVLTVSGGALRAVLHRRPDAPQKGRWALPGGFVGFREGLDEAAARVLAAKGGVERVYLEQLYTFGTPRRDPRTRVISVVYFALVDAQALELGLADRTDVHLVPLSIPWEGETGGPVVALGDDQRPLRLAFDHAEILGMAALRLRGKLDYAAIGFELLPRQFTLRALQDVHETILGRELNKDSFRRRMLASKRISPTGKREKDVIHRPAELYRFSPTTGSPA
jgi:8-oxo-dGTP diphosphatase